MTTRCRHSSSWIMAGGHIEWCYRCGAVRRLRKISPMASVPASTWARPVGPDGKNPWPKVRGVGSSSAEVKP